MTVTLCSLLLQVMHWLIYTWTSFPAGLLAITPLLLCGIYHAYQADSSQNHGLKRLQVFLTAVLVPFLLSILVSALCYGFNPDLTVFHPMAVQERNAAEYLALFSGRISITSFYLLVFSAVDIPLQHWQESRRTRKTSSKSEPTEPVGGKE